MRKVRKFLGGLLVSILIIALAVAAYVILVSEYIKKESAPDIISVEKAAQNNDYDCILVLGCQVRSTGPSPMLKDRLEMGIELYEKNASEKLLMSGDHSTKYYDEVDAMKDYAVEKGVPSEDVFMDHAGLNTYDSLYRARDIFGAKKVLIVTQEYHLYRALYLAKKLGIEAQGVKCDTTDYAGQEMRDLREIGARNKAFIFGMIKPKPTYLGESISLDGDGNITNDGVVQ